MTGGRQPLLPGPQFGDRYVESEHVRNRRIRLQVVARRQDVAAAVANLVISRWTSAGLARWSHP